MEAAQLVKLLLLLKELGETITLFEFMNNPTLVSAYESIEAAILGVMEEIENEI